MADVPPELRPYYREQAVAARVRRTMVRVLVSLAVLAILAGGGTWAWLHRHSLKLGTGGNHPAVTQHQSAPPNAPQQSGSQPNTGPSSNANSSQTPAPNTPPSGSGSGSNAPQPSQPDINNSTPPAPHTSLQPASPAPIPNTGPGASVLVIGIVMAVAGVAVYRTYQKRTIRS